MALKTTSAVISFIMLDGARNSSAFFSNSTLPLEASIRIAVGASPSKPPSFLLGALHAVVGGVDHPAPPDRQRDERPPAGRATGDPVAASDLREDGCFDCHRRCPEARRSNSWKYRKQHGFCPMPRRRSDCGTDQTTVSCGAAISSTKSPKQGGKAMSSSRTISANGIEIFVREQGQGPLVLLCHGWPELSYSWRHQIPAIAAAGFQVVGPRYARFRPDQRARRCRRLQHLRQCRRHGRAGGGARRKAGGHRRP